MAGSAAVQRGGQLPRFHAAKRRRLRRLRTHPSRGVLCVPTDQTSSTGTGGDRQDLRDDCLRSPAVMQGLGGPDEDRRGGFDRGGWAIPLVDTEAGDYLNEIYGGAAAFLFGRRTYKIFAGSWAAIPEMITSPIGAALNSRLKYVVLITRTHERWPDLADLTIRHRRQVVYVAGGRRDGTTLPLVRLRYGGSANSWGFAIPPHRPRQLQERRPAQRLPRRYLRRSTRLRLRPRPQRPHRLDLPPDCCLQSRSGTGPPHPCPHRWPPSSAGSAKSSSLKPCCAATASASAIVDNIPAVATLKASGDIPSSALKILVLWPTLRPDL